MKVREIEIREFGVKITVFENGDVYVWTDGDVHILKARRVIKEGDG